MNNDYDVLRDVFEMAEVLESAGEHTLKLLAPKEPEGDLMPVFFKFNDDKELVEVYIENV